MKRFLIILVFILLNDRATCSNELAFMEDTNQAINQTYAFPDEYRTSTRLPGLPMNKSWSIGYPNARYEPLVIGRMSLIEPQKNHDTCEVKFAFDHRMSFKSEEGCFEAITRLLQREASRLAYGAFSKHVDYLTVTALYLGDAEKHIKQMNRLGWHVKPTTDSSSGFDIIFLVYTLELQPFMEEKEKSVVLDNILFYGLKTLVKARL
jgi:hypothetical protein